MAQEDEETTVTNINDLSERERALLHACIVEKARSYRRKRSWRPSEIAISTGALEALGRKLGLPSIFKEQ